MTVLAIAERLRRKEIHWRLYVSILGLFLLVAFYISWRDKTIDLNKELNSKTPDLRFTIKRYSYSGDKRELVSEIIFMNNGHIRRIVTGVNFTYSLGEKPQLVGTSSVEDGHASCLPVLPAYVDPFQPITVTCKDRLDDTTLTNKLGARFGLEIIAARTNGAASFTWVEAMCVAPVGDAPAFAFISRDALSLDKDGRYLMGAEECFGAVVVFRGCNADAMIHAAFVNSEYGNFAAFTNFVRVSRKMYSFFRLLKRCSSSSR